MEVVHSISVVQLPHTLTQTLAMSAEHLLAELAPILRVLTDPAGGDVTE